MLSEKEMRRAARELNEVTELNPPLDADLPLKDLKEELLDGIKYIKDSDVFTRETQSVIDELTGKTEKKEPVYYEIPPEEEEVPEDEVDIPLTEETKILPRPAKKVAPNIKKAKDTRNGSVHDGSLAEFMDDIISKGGTWEELIRLGSVECKRRGLTKNFTKATLKSHIKYRQSRNEKFFGDAVIDSEGVKV